MEERREDLQPRLEACLRHLINRNGGEMIDTVSLFLVERIANDVAILLNVPPVDIRCNVGITQMLANRGRR